MYNVQVVAVHLVRGHYKTWTLDSGLDHGLNSGLNNGLDRQGSKVTQQQSYDVLGAVSLKDSSSVR